MKNSRIELLAPAGNLKILKAAVDHGADAVYLGIGAYNARINAENFTAEDLAEGIKYAHLRSSKIYLTLNTLVNDYEMDEALKLACDAYLYGVDGIIIQDIGLASAIHEKYPDITLNASTQMNVFSEDEFKRLSDMGFKRIVLPRELSVDEISRRTNIAKRYGMTTEVFAHGAVCVCYSGLCLFSAMNKGGTRSGNRGLCAQPCRQEYKLSNDGLVLNEGHLLSPKDRDVIDYISGLIAAGVSSLKLEGRMRDVNYVSSAVSSYRRILDAYYDGTLDKDIIDSVKRDLLINFNRGGSFTSQYLSGSKPDDFLSGEYVGKFGLQIGKIKTMDPKKGTVTITRNPDYPVPSKGDFLSVRSRNKEITSFPVGKIHEGSDFLAIKGLHPDMIKKTERGMEIYLMGHKTEIDKKDKKRTHIDLSVDSEERCLKLNAMVNSGMNYGLFAETSLSLDSGEDFRPLTEERIREQLSKTLDTPFAVDNIYFVKKIDQGFPVSMINDLRRKVIDLLIEEIDNSYKRAVNPKFQIPGFTETNSEPGRDLTMHIYPEARTMVSSISPGADIYGFTLYDLANKKFREEISRFLIENDALLCAVLPDLYHDRMKKIITNVFDDLKSLLGDRFYACLDSKTLNSREFYEGYGLKHFVSGGGNLYNSDSVNVSADSADGGFISYELSQSEAVEMFNDGKLPYDYTYLIQVSGMIPWMQSDFCPVGQNRKHCSKCSSAPVFEFGSKENANADLKIIPRNIDCSSVIYGPAKYLYDDEDVSRINDLGYNTISCFTFI